MKIETRWSKFKTLAPKNFRRVELTGQPVLITDHGKPAFILGK